MEEQIKTEKKRDYVLPASILVAALLVSLALVYNAGKNAGNSGVANLSGIGGNELQGHSPENVKPATGEDHIRGSVNASVVIIEFSDFECPFCKSFHNTMKQVLAA